MSQSLLAPAKINLFLHVGDKRADGFHPLQSLAVFPALGDSLTAEAADELSLSVTGPFAAALNDGNRRRGRQSGAESGARPGGESGLFARRRPKLTLIKNLPVASGIGGGSADAAAALRALSALWQLASG